MVLSDYKKLNIFFEQEISCHLLYQLVIFSQRFSYLLTHILLTIFVEAKF